MVATSSIDTTVTIWDLEKSRAKTQLIAHDKEVYDVCFALKSKDLFASVGADGSVRMFDLRNLEHSSIIYESDNNSPLLRLVWNKQDPNYLATLQMDGNQTFIIDIRQPSKPVSTLNNHQACVNALAWAPHSSCHICTAGDDKQTLIWDLQKMPAPIEDPILAYQAGGEVNNMQWSSAQAEWVAITFNRNLEILRV